MPSKNQTVMKVNKTTLETIREIGRIAKMSPPKVVDWAVEVLVHEHAVDIAVKGWREIEHASAGK